MKKLWLILSLMVLALSACYIEPIRDRDGGYHRDRDHDGHHQNRGDRDRDRDHDRDDRYRGR